MWWKKEKEEKPELTEEQIKKIQTLTDLKQNMWDNIIKATKDDNVELVYKWIEVFEKIKNYRYNF